MTHTYHMTFWLSVLPLQASFSLTCSVASLSLCLKYYSPGHYILDCSTPVTCQLGVEEPSTCLMLPVISHFFSSKHCHRIAPLMHQFSTVMFLSVR